MPSTHDPTTSPDPPPPTDLDTARNHRLHATGYALLTDIARRVRAGYAWHTGGEVPATKILGVVAKLSRHGTHLDRLTRHRRKADGEPAAVLFVWPVRNDPVGYTTTFRFLLLATEPLDGEHMQDGKHKPVRCNLYPGDAAEFHLRPKKVPPKKGSGRRPKGGNDFVYDWVLSPNSYTLMYERLRVAARSEASQLQQAVRAYTALPMPAGYRSQLKEVLQLVKPVWRANNRPSVIALRKQIKEGAARDPFGPPPIQTGFPKLYADPPETLAEHLKHAEQLRKQIARERLAEQRQMHDQPSPATLLLDLIELEDTP